NLEVGDRSGRSLGIDYVEECVQETLRERRVLSRRESRGTGGGAGRRALQLIFEPRLNRRSSGGASSSEVLRHRVVCLREALPRSCVFHEVRRRIQVHTLQEIPSDMPDIPGLDNESLSY